MTALVWSLTWDRLTSLSSALYKTYPIHLYFQYHEHTLIVNSALTIKFKFLIFHFFTFHDSTRSTGHSWSSGTKCICRGDLPSVVDLNCIYIPDSVFL